jgi:CHASE2 domain-containing sensor protein
LRQQLQQIWQVGTAPGLMIVGLIVGLRLLGLLQPLEWWALDFLLRWRPPQPTDEQILIVGIDEQDIQSIGTYPIPDIRLAELIQKLQTAQPKAIGLDIIRDLPVEPGHETLTALLQQSGNLFGIERALPDEAGRTIPPPPGLPPERVGFVDLLYDSDGALRRALIGTPTPAGYKFSLPLLLAERYLKLAQPPLEMENGRRDFEAMRFGQTELTRFKANSGGYVNAANVDARGNQFLINYRNGPTPFRVVSLSEVMQNQVPAEQIRDRLVLIGMMATSVGDLKQTNAVNNSGLIYGVEAHAHIASQIIGSVLHGRPWLNVWESGFEYIWVISWGILGIGLGRVWTDPLKVILGTGLAGALLLGVSFGAIVCGWWLAVVPAFLALVCNSLITTLFYRHQQELQSRLRERQQLIDQIYTAIHNGPVQTVASILRKVRSQSLLSPSSLSLLPSSSQPFPDQFESDLEHLEQELRAIDDTIRQALLQTDDVYVCGTTKLNLQQPLAELLYGVYYTTLNRTRDFPVFGNVIKLSQFDPIDSQRLTIQQKQGLCRFLEEALCNAGKYAEGMTRLEVCCKMANGWVLLRVVDNGAGIKSIKPAKEPKSKQGGYGTKQATAVAKQLGGRFRREPNSPKGTLCELTYPVIRPRFRYF